MNDSIFKLKVLYYKLLASYYNWKETCLRVNLTEVVCCNRWECSCEAADYKTQFLEQIQRHKEFIRSHK